MRTPQDRLLSLLVVHDGHCSVVIDSELYTEAVKLEGGGCISFRVCSVGNYLGMIEVHFINRTSWTNRKALLALRDELRKQNEM